MSFTSPTIQPLEPRRHLSVGAVSLAGSLKPGAVFVYQTTTNAHVLTTATQTVIGPATLAGHPATRVDSRQSIGGATIIDSQYLLLDPAKGLLLDQLVENQSLGAYQTITTDTFSPMQTLFPKSLTPGKTYTFKWTDTAATDIPLIHSHSQSVTTVARSIKLLTAKPAKLKVPAGTFSCYRIQLTTRSKTGNASSITTKTQYIAPNIGLIKSTDSTTSPNTPTRTSTTLLKKYIKPIART